MIDEEASGERFIPEVMSGDLIDAEHQARYRLAAAQVDGRRVLDAGCGVGWGSQVLLDGGAASVLGVDIDAGAVANATARTPGARFVQGDLTALALPADAFDVVVCFEALEHVGDPMACLDELVRVLTPDGVLFVSSPNPEVYPAGNPFHIRELPPDELVTEVGKRLTHTRLFRQHLLVSSLLHPDDVATGTAPLEVVTRTIGPLAVGHDPYSLVVASHLPLPELPGVDMLAPSHQLDHLESLAATLVDERAAMQAERVGITEAFDALQAQLSEADAGLQRLTADNERALAALAVAHDDVAELAEIRVDPDRRIGEHDQVVARAAAERDRFAAGLVHSEQSLARANHDLDVAHREVDELRRAVDALQAELEATLATVSWRLTRPLRDVRRRSPRR